MKSAVVLIVVLIVTACGGTASKSGSSDPGASAAGSAPASQGPATPLSMPANLSLEALGGGEDEILRALVERAGGERLVPGMTDAVIQLRHDALGTLLDAAAASPKVASSDPAAGPPVTAFGALIGGDLMALSQFVGILMSEFTPSAVPGSGSVPSSGEEDLVIDGLRAHSSMQAAFTLATSGSMLAGDVTMTITTTVFDANGAVVGTLTVTSAGGVEIEMCPDANGSVHASFDLDITTTATGAGVGGTTAGTAGFKTSGSIVGHVSEDAFLTGYTFNSAAATSSSGGSGPAIDRALTLAGGVSLSGAPGDVGSVTMPTDPTSATVRADADATTADMTTLLHQALDPSMQVATFLLDAAQKRWRDGSCVKIVSSETGRDVQLNERVTFTARPVHKVEGTDLDKPVVATLAGQGRLSPAAGTKQDAPATITFTAPNRLEAVSTVSLKSTSNRGIGMLDVRFRTDSPFDVELRILSKFTISKVTGHPTTNAVARASGKIRLTYDPATDTWKGRGELTSQTTSDVGPCNTMTVAGTGTYDWVVNAVVVLPGIAADKIVLHMDAGSTVEQPDRWRVPICRSAVVLRGTMNTWENMFFVNHNADFKANGLVVTGWTLSGELDPWRAN